MNILLLFIFNVFTGALIYLILSLKIEKTSSTFQEKKLKREMGEIIREFNSTAERNISILENHISVLRKLMNENGSLKGVDFTVLDNQLRNNYTRNGTPDKIENKNQKKINEKHKNISKEIVKPLNDKQEITGTFFKKINLFNTDEEDSRLLQDNLITSDKVAGKTNGPFFIGEKNSGADDPHIERINLYADEDIVVKYENEKKIDITDMFQNTDDKYMLIAQLYSEGYSIEDISKYSGLPSGEIKLVISLNS